MRPPRLFVRDGRGQGLDECLKRFGDSTASPKPPIDLGIGASALSRVVGTHCVSVPFATARRDGKSRARGLASNLLRGSAPIHFSEIVWVAVGVAGGLLYPGLM